VRKMSLSDVGVRAHLRAASWDSDEPGTLPPDPREIGKITGIDPRIIRKFLAKYPGLFSESSGKLYDTELCEQARNYREISEERSKAAKSSHPRKPAIAEQKQTDKEVDREGEGEGCSLMQFPQDQQEAKLQEPVPTRSQVEKAIGKTAKRLDPASNRNEDQRAHLESGIYRKKIGDAYFDATRAGMTPDECVREAITAGALTLAGNRSVELKGLRHEELAEHVWERLRKNLSALHALKSFEIQSGQVVAVVTRNLTDVALEFWERRSDAN
jgi:hypothetical protein